MSMFKVWNVYVQSSKCLCSDFEMSVFRVWNVYVQSLKCLCSGYFKLLNTDISNSWTQIFQTLNIDISNSEHTHFKLCTLKFQTLTIDISVWNVYVQSLKCLCSRVWNVYVQSLKCICSDFEMSANSEHRHFKLWTYTFQTLHIEISNSDHRHFKLWI
jgi:hypothetical protein